MNQLATEQRAKILNCLVEGCSMRATSRLTGAAKKTVERLLVSAGTACAEYHDKTMRNLPCKVLQVDEVWSFTYAKQANLPEHLKDEEGFGDTWTWIAEWTDGKARGRTLIKTIEGTVFSMSVLLLVVAKSPREYKKSPLAHCHSCVRSNRVYVIAL